MSENKTLDIFPTGKFKRILTFLGDLLLFYILTVSMFQLVVFNIASACTNYSSRLENNLETINSRMDILYNNELLFYDESNKYSFDSSLDTTFDYFLRSYVIKDTKDPIMHYFNDLDNNKNLNEVFNKYNELGNEYFNINNNEITLKDEYLDYFKPYFDTTDSLSSLGRKYLSTFRSKTFVSLYNYMLEDILKDDLSFNNLSYINLSNKINENSNYNLLFNSINITISFIISFLIYYVLIPLLFKDRSTLVEHVLKEKRIDLNSFEFLKRRNYIVIIANNLLMSLSIIFFIGIIYMGFYSLFNYMHFLIISILSIVFILINLFILLFNPFNKTLKELSTKTILISQESLEEIYRSKGYGE